MRTICRIFTVLLYLLVFWPASAFAFDQQEWDRYLGEVDALRNAGTITRAERMQRLKVKMQSMNSAYDALEEEDWSYKVYIASRVDKGGMSAEEAKYLMTQKTNEIDARRQQAANRPASEAFKTCYRSCMAEMKQTYATQSTSDYHCSKVECGRYR